MMNFDPHGRKVDYLRVSVTDRCNERCLYCMPEGYKGWALKPDHLTLDELLLIIRAAATLGFRKIRLTGGEPLLRHDLPDLVGGISATPGIECVGLSTNGVLLAGLASRLLHAGLRTVNISLDALNPQIYQRITGGNVERVLEGIRAVANCGFERVKLNCVLMRGVNEREIWPLVLFAAEHGFPLRLIELMPVTTSAVLTPSSFFPISEAMELLGGHEELEPVESSHLGWGPAKYYRLRKTGAMVGFIGAMTNRHFCESCNKMRLTADGRVRPCLGDHGEVNLLDQLRRTPNLETARKVLTEALLRKPLEHQFRECYVPERPMTAIGG